ncbi:MAG TPA: pilus assembly protein PilP [Vicinamibacterales bacterium]|nr:pilus assembly protein PilP [Vicinamibacterales bacterium]
MRLLIALVAALFATSASAAPSPTAQPAKPGAETAPSPVAPAAPSNQPAAPYNYNPEGRRDPFQSLTGTGGDSKSAPRPAVAGITGIRVDELSVRGIMQSRERLVAMVQGPENRTYLIHQGDKLADGVVKSITPQGLVLDQDVSDPRAKEKTREVRKLLRSAEDEKE